MDFNDARPLLLPVLKSVSQPAAALRAAAADPDRALVRKRLVPFLHTLLAIDGPDKLTYVSRGSLDEWGVSAKDAFALAMGNLDPTHGLSRWEGLWRLDSNDGLDASRLCLPGWLRAFEGRVDGAPMAIVPAPRILLVGGEADAERLLSIAREGWEREGSPISPCAYTLAFGKLVPYMPTQGHALRVTAENQQKMLIRREYEQQRDVLEGIYDLTIARVGLLEEAGTGRLITVSSWTEGTDPLLPVCEVVVLHPQDGDALWVPWKSVAEVAEGQMQLDDSLDPPRVRASGWMSDQAWAALAAVAVRQGA